MGKFYIGTRGSGKTVRLLRQAEALLDWGLQPIIVTAYKHNHDMFEPIAERNHIRIKGVEYLSVSDILSPKFLSYRNNDRARFLLDETYCVLQVLFNNNICGTISTEDTVELHREDWDPNYVTEKSDNE